jgi:hypothetical protein
MREQASPVREQQQVFLNNHGAGAIHQVWGRQSIQRMSSAADAAVICISRTGLA